MSITLKIWRQEHAATPGGFVRYQTDVDPATSLLDALDALNDDLVSDGERPIAFDSDCREGICGACGVIVNGYPHGGRKLVTTCEFPLRDALGKNGSGEITVEPFRTGAFPVVCDLVVDRSALDRVIMAGGFVSVRTGSAPEANAVAVPKRDAERALDDAACIGCGACVAACPNGSAALFTGAKLSHLGHLPQGAPERSRRVLSMTKAADQSGFGACSLHGECERACPKGIHVDVIGRMNRDALVATIGRGNR